MVAPLGMTDAIPASFRLAGDSIPGWWMKKASSSAVAPSWNRSKRPTAHESASVPSASEPRAARTGVSRSRRILDPTRELVYSVRCQDARDRYQVDDREHGAEAAAIVDEDGGSVDQREDEACRRQQPPPGHHAHRPEDSQNEGDQRDDNCHIAPERAPEERLHSGKGRDTGHPVHRTGPVRDRPGTQTGTA